MLTHLPPAQRVTTDLQPAEACGTLNTDGVCPFQRAVTFALTALPSTAQLPTLEPNRIAGSPGASARRRHATGPMPICGPLPCVRHHSASNR